MASKPDPEDSDKHPGLRAAVGAGNCHSLSWGAGHSGDLGGDPGLFRRVLEAGPTWEVRDSSLVLLLCPSQLCSSKVSPTEATSLAW